MFARLVASAIDAAHASHLNPSPAISWRAHGAARRATSPRSGAHIQSRSLHCCSQWDSPSRCRMTQRLLYFSVRHTLDPKVTDVNNLVNGMLDLIQPQLRPRNLRRDGRSASHEVQCDTARQVREDRSPQTMFVRFCGWAPWLTFRYRDSGPLILVQRPFVISTPKTHPDILPNVACAFAPKFAPIS